jgi:hypothetical protein
MTCLSVFKYLWSVMMGKTEQGIESKKLYSLSAIHCVHDKIQRYLRVKKIEGIGKGQEERHVQEG